jgi:hypothetical protein
MKTSAKKNSALIVRHDCTRRFFGNEEFFKKGIGAHFFARPRGQKNRALRGCAIAPAPALRAVAASRPSNHGCKGLTAASQAATTAHMRNVFLRFQNIAGSPGLLRPFHFIPAYMCHSSFSPFPRLLDIVKQGW